MNANDRKQQGGGPKADQEQQQQKQGGEGQQYGEGSYSGTRQYNEGVKEHMQNHDVEREARDAAPRNASEEKEMEEAERAGRSKARGKDDVTLEGNSNPGENDAGEK